VSRRGWKEFPVRLLQSLNFPAQCIGFRNGEIDQSWQLKTVRFNGSGMEDNVSLLAIDRPVEARHLLFVAERKAALACDRSKDKGVVAHADNTLGASDECDLFGWRQVFGNLTVEGPRVVAEVFRRVRVGKGLWKENNAAVLAEALDDRLDDLTDLVSLDLAFELSMPSPELIGDEDAVVP